MTEQTPFQSEKEQKKEQRKKGTRAWPYVVGGILIVALVSIAVVGLGRRLWPGTNTVKVVVALPADPVEGEGFVWSVIHAIQLALEEADYQAGDLTVELVVKNTADAEGTIVDVNDEAAAQEAAQDPQVVAFLGSFSSESSKLSIPVLNRAGVTQLSPSASYPGLTKSGFAAGEPAVYYPTGQRTFFRLATPDDMQGAAAAFWAKDLGLERIYIITGENAYSQGLNRSFQRAAQDVGLTIVNIRIITAEEVEADDETWEEIASGIAANVTDQQPDLVYFAGSAYSSLIRAIREAGGETISFMGTDALYSQGPIDDLGPLAEGLMATFISLTPDDLGTAGEEFSRRFQERFGYEPGPFAALGYDGMGIVLAAIEQAGQADRATVLEAMRQVQYDGLAGHWSFDENGDTNLMFISGVRVENGEWQSIGLLRAR